MVLSERARVPPLLTLMLLVPPRALAAPAVRMPPLMVVAPVKVFAPVRTTVPAVVLLMAADPARLALMLPFSTP